MRAVPVRLGEPPLDEASARHLYGDTFLVRAGGRARRCSRPAFANFHRFGRRDRRRLE
jgi:hypothetical protein